MKCWTPFLVFAWLFLAAFAAYTNDELRQLLASKGKRGVIELVDEDFEQYLKGPRDYHLVLYMASDSPKLNCVLCREVRPAYTTVAESWSHDFPNGLPDDETDIYFLEADFVSSKELFQLMELESIPKIFHFPPTQASDSANSWIRNRNEYQFFAGEHAVLIKQFVTGITGRNFDIYEPINYSKVFMNAAVTFALVMLLRKFSHYLVALLKSTFVWGSLSLVLVLVFISGYMFNQIRGTPFVREQGDRVEYFAPSSQMQYGLETQVISTLYGLLGLVFVLLITKISKIEHPKVQFFGAVLVSALIYVLFSLFMSLFSVKFRGYPYTLLEFKLF